MSLFPTCRFTLLLGHAGSLAPGTRAEGMLVLTVPEHIPRAEHVDLVIKSSAWAGYGSGKSRNVVTRDMFVRPLQVTLPPGGLGPGEHRYPFTVDLPANLPVAYAGSDCGITHQCELRLDVDWAIDPTATMRLEMVPPAVMDAARSPVAVRSPQGFHDAVALDLTLSSNVLARGEPIDGVIALRSGHQADFGGVSIELRHLARVSMACKDVRSVSLGSVGVPAAALRSGQGVPFRFPSTKDIPPENVNGFLDLYADLVITLDAGLFSHPKFSVPIRVLPAGSRLVGELSSVPVGQSRLTTLAAFLAAQVGVRTAQLPALIAGDERSVTFSLEDGSRGGEYHSVETYAFPDLAMGLTLRPSGVFTSSSPATPARLKDTFALQTQSHPGVPAVPALSAFFERVLAFSPDVVGVELSDHRLQLRRRLPSDEAPSWLAVAQTMRGRARELADAIASLPFAVADQATCAAWQAASREEEAWLLAHSPALVGLRRTVRTLGGEERSFVATLSTRWADGQPSTWLDLSHANAPLPGQAIESLSQPSPSENLRVVRARFPDVHAAGQEHVVATAPGLAPDPRALLPALDALVAWVLEARGEKTTTAPYR